MVRLRTALLCWDQVEVPLATTVGVFRDSEEREVPEVEECS